MNALTISKIRRFLTGPTRREIAGEVFRLRNLADGQRMALDELKALNAEMHEELAIKRIELIDANNHTLAVARMAGRFRRTLQLIAERSNETLNLKPDDERIE